MDRNLSSLGDLGLGGGDRGGGGGLPPPVTGGGDGFAPVVASAPTSLSSTVDPLADALEALDASGGRHGGVVLCDITGGASSSAPSSSSSGEAPLLICQSATTAIYRHYDTGYKVLLDPNPSEERILRLLHEQKVSNCLPPTCRGRRVLDVTSYQRRPALSFKWAKGITLYEWLVRVGLGRGGGVDGIIEGGLRLAARGTCPSSSPDLAVRLRAAMAISRTLADFHSCGVVHNSLVPENIVLAPSEGEYVATFVDLSRALIYKEHMSDRGVNVEQERQMREVDLRALGAVLNGLFRGDETGCVGAGAGDCLGEPGDGSDGRRKRGKRRSPGEGLPLYLSSLISALSDTSFSAKSGQRYPSAMDVYLDLKMLAENPNGPLGRAGQLDELMSRGRLRLLQQVNERGSAFYGRQAQMSMLLHLFQSAVALGNRPLMATIAGYPGTG